MDIIVDLSENFFDERFCVQNGELVEEKVLIVVVAHYDHMGKMGDEVYFPGANDNAGGVAMILNLAKHFKSNECVNHIFEVLTGMK